MFRSITQLLGNITVRAKLALGFSAVLTLTLLIAYTGWHGLSSLGERGDKLITIAKLNEQVRDMRITRLLYALTADSQHATAVTQATTIVERQIAKIRAQLETPESQRWLDQAERALDQYRGHFNDFSRAISTPGGEGKSMQAQDAPERRHRPFA